MRSAQPTIGECFSCYGPKEQANLTSLATWYANAGTQQGHLLRLIWQL